MRKILSLFFCVLNASDVIVLLFGFLIFCRRVRIIFGDFFVLLLGDGVKATDGEGITAQYAPHRQIKAHEKATFLKRLKGVGRASRRKPTARISFER